MNEDYSRVLKLIEDGMQGKNRGIPMGFKRLNAHISIRKGTYYLIGGYTGSGKTSLVDDAFVLNPVDYLTKHADSDKKLKIIYFSMERPKVYKLAKWLCRKVFLEEGVVISTNKAIGWVDDPKYLINDTEYKLL